MVDDMVMVPIEANDVHEAAVRALDELAGFDRVELEVIGNMFRPEERAVLGIRK